MKVLIITVAGMSTRFSRSLKKQVLKCVYYQTDYKQSILYRLIRSDDSFDKIIVVGGYKYDDLINFIETHLSDLKDKIDVVFNDKYSEYGSGYSLYFGLKKALEYRPNEMVFAEGDLCVSAEEFKRFCALDTDAVSYNFVPIQADKAVIFYLDEKGGVKYLYDTAHCALKIDEPFTAIYNSAQIWKMSDFNRAKNAFDALDEKSWQGTNLVYIQRYFSTCKNNEYGLFGFKRWFNCNTVDDFLGSLEEEK